MDTLCDWTEGTPSLDRGQNQALVGGRWGQPRSPPALRVSVFRDSIFPRSDRTVAESLVALILLPVGRGGGCGKGRMRLLRG